MVQITLRPLSAMFLATLMPKGRGTGAGEKRNSARMRGEARPTRLDRTSITCKAPIVSNPLFNTTNNGVLSQETRFHERTKGNTHARARVSQLRGRLVHEEN